MESGEEVFFKMGKEAYFDGGSEDSIERETIMWEKRDGVLEL